MKLTTLIVAITFFLAPAESHAGISDWFARVFGIRSSESRRIISFSTKAHTTLDAESNVFKEPVLARSFDDAMEWAEKLDPKEIHASNGTGWFYFKKQMGRYKDSRSLPHKEFLQTLIAGLSMVGMRATEKDNEVKGAHRRLLENPDVHPFSVPVFTSPADSDKQIFLLAMAGVHPIRISPNTQIAGGVLRLPLSLFSYDLGQGAKLLETNRKWLYSPDKKLNTKALGNNVDWAEKVWRSVETLDDAKMAANAKRFLTTYSQGILEYTPSGQQTFQTPSLWLPDLAKVLAADDQLKSLAQNSLSQFPVGQQPAENAMVECLKWIKTQLPK